MIRAVSRFEQFQSTLPVWGATESSPRTRAICYQFQSTLPVWGATSFPLIATLLPLHFNPRSPCGERPRGTRSSRMVCGISIHAPRVGSDQRAHLRPSVTGYFKVKLLYSQKYEKLVVSAHQRVQRIEMYSPIGGTSLWPAGTSLPASIYRNTPLPPSALTSKPVVSE